MKLYYIKELFEQDIEKQDKYLCLKDDSTESMWCLYDNCWIEKEDYEILSEYEVADDEHILNSFNIDRGM